MSTHSLEIDQKTLFEMITSHFGIKIPSGARGFITVPGGADWSNCDLELDMEPIKIEWCEIAENTQGD